MEQRGLTGHHHPGTTKYSHLYDADGELLIKRPTGGGAGTTFLYLGNTEVQVTKSAGATPTYTVKSLRYYQHQGSTVAVRSGVPGTAHKLTLVAVDQSGTVSAQWDAMQPLATRVKRFSDPFGAPRGPVRSSWVDDKGFLGKPLDKTTGLTHIGAREYDAVLGRFLSVDPLLDVSDPQSANGYTYSNNNPVNLSDPSGLGPVDINGERANCDTCGPNWSGSVGQDDSVAQYPAAPSDASDNWNAIQAQRAEERSSGASAQGSARQSAGGLLRTLPFCLFGCSNPDAYSDAQRTVVEEGVKIGGFDYECRGWSCGAEVAMVLPALKLGKLGKAGRLIFGSKDSVGTVVMGRNMGQRVIPYAERNNYGYYKGTPKYVPRKTIARASPATVDKVDLWFNKRWINGQVGKGNKIIDIGEPSGYPSSPFYNMELEQTRGYWNYFEDIQP